MPLSWPALTPQPFEGPMAQENSPALRLEALDDSAWSRDGPSPLKPQPNSRLTNKINYYIVLSYEVLEQFVIKHEVIKTAKGKREDFKPIRLENKLYSES